MPTIFKAGTTAAGMEVASSNDGLLVLRTSAANGTAVVDAISLAADGTATLISGLRGPATMFSPITNSLASNVTLADATLYYAGPSVAQGSAGTWFVSGTIVSNAAAGNNLNYKLWDGTTVIAGAAINHAGTNTPVSLSGFITSPAGNLRISVNNQSANSGTIMANASANGNKDSTITAIRIA